MQPTSGDLTSSPATPLSSHGHRGPDSFTMRRLSAAIDALRREGEAILWELNSLKTQNLTLEQRMLGQAEELDTIARGLVILREQHRVMEQQYQEKLRALRSELRAIQGEHPSTSTLSTNASASARERSPSSPSSPQLFGTQHSLQHPMPQATHLLTSLTSATQVPKTPTSRRGYARNPLKDMDSASAVPSRVHSAARHSCTPPHTRPPTSLQLSSIHSSYTPRPPRGGSMHRTAHPHYHYSNDVTSPARREPSVSPTATLVGSDTPSQPRSRKARS